MIYEGSCDTEDWNFSFAITGINYIYNFCFRIDKINAALVIIRGFERLWVQPTTLLYKFYCIRLCYFWWKSYGFGRMGWVNFHFWMNFSFNPLTNYSNPASVTRLRQRNLCPHFTSPCHNSRFHNEVFKRANSLLIYYWILPLSRFLCLSSSPPMSQTALGLLSCALRCDGGRLSVARLWN